MDTAQAVEEVDSSITRDFNRATRPIHPIRKPLGWVFSHLLNNRGYILAYVIAVLASHFANAMLPVFIGQAFAVISDHVMLSSAIVAAVVGLLIATLIRFVSELTGNLSIEIIAQRLKRDTRLELFTSLLGKSQTFHDRQNLGDIVARAINDAHLLDLMISPGLNSAINTIIAIVVPTAFIAFFNLELLLAPALFLLLFMATVNVYVRKLYPVTRLLRQQFGLMNSRLMEDISGIDLIKWSNQEAAEKERFTFHTDRYRDTFIRRGKIQAMYLPSLCLAVTTVVGAVHALALYANGTLAIEQVVTYLGWLGLLYLPIATFEQSIAALQEGYAGATRMLELINDQDLDQAYSAPNALTKTIQGDITFKNVSYHYEGNYALKNISLSIHAGETVAILGPTGSGKSTLIKLINGIFVPSQGEVLIDESPIQCWAKDGIRTQVANVEQDIFLFSKSIMDNITLSAKGAPDIARVKRAANMAHIDEFIMSCDQGYHTVLSEGGRSLSGGQKQRLAIARALFMEPAILILDDSTSAVDSITENQIQASIRNVAQGRTTLLITHRMPLIMDADRIILLDAGTVIDQGSHKELFERCKLYRHIYCHEPSQ